ncbi:MAG TPA: protein-L-isoaspartate(D-aspartate) O-methyltransferase [Thermoanaerobaculia bacterium]|nr:protein-L-isoaspartate(D-aspartate) O-methyltransferase [Thermoanaerobaculia bacterium]
MRVLLALLLVVAGVAGVRPLEAEDLWSAQRRSMVDDLRQRGIKEASVLEAMGKVPRHLFVPDAVRAQAYQDQPLALGAGRSIYQPYVVALMTSLLHLEKGDKVLEVGTGTGYHAAVLSRIAREVYSIEIVAPVASQARQRLQTLGYSNIEVRVGDGYQGWAGKGPFDAILISAAPPHIPKPLIDQLRVGGRMVVPLGGVLQDLLVITKTEDGLERRTVIPVRLTPMTGKVRDGR